MLPWALQGYCRVGHCRDTPLAARILCGCCWPLQGYSAVAHCKDSLHLGTARILCGWALQGYTAVGHRRDAWWLGIAGILCGWALQGYLAVGHCKDTRWLDTAGYSAVGHCRDAAVGVWRDTLPLSTAVRLHAEGGDNIDFSNLTTPLQGWGTTSVGLRGSPPATYRKIPAHARSRNFRNRNMARCSSLLTDGRL